MLPTGGFKQEVLLKTNDPASPTLVFNVVGNIQATLSVVPEVITLTSAKVGVMETRKSSSAVHALSASWAWTVRAMA